LRSALAAAAEPDLVVVNHELIGPGSNRGRFSFRDAA